jgi:hypothetical protein
VASVSVAFKIFDPSEVVIQSGLLGQKIKKAKRAAKAAEQAAAKARKAKDRQRLLADVTNQTYEVAGRLRMTMFPNGKHVQLLVATDGQSRRTSGIAWPLTKDESYVLFLTDKHLLFIAEVGESLSDLTMLTYKRFAKLKTLVLSEINDHLKELGTQKTASVAAPEMSKDSRKSAGQDDDVDKVKDEPASSVDDQLPNPDVSSADTSLYKQPTQANQPDASWLEGSTPSTR